ncbi:MAG: hypothetical protein MZV49_00385 [Rhodopseudomonas palustris]|nr:hypothetical protein [Rhodopseudomonas palustris]
MQPMSLAYVKFSGLPIGRALRERVAWYGDVDLIPHFIGVLASGAIDVTVSWGEPIPPRHASRPQADRAPCRSRGATPDRRRVARRRRRQRRPPQRRACQLAAAARLTPVPFNAHSVAPCPAAAACRARQNACSNILRDLFHGHS